MIVFLGLFVVILLVLFLCALSKRLHRVEVLMEGVFKEREENFLLMSDKKAWFCRFEKPCVKCRSQLANGEAPEKLWPPGSGGCGEAIPLKARLLKKLPQQWDAVRLVVGRNIFGTIISYEFGVSYDFGMVEKSLKLKARLADTGIDVATGKPKLYDLSKDDYPLKEGTEVRTMQAATCMVCGAYTNKGVVTDPFAHSSGPGDALSFRCPHTNMMWHLQCAQIDLDSCYLFSEVMRLSKSSDSKDRWHAEKLDAALKEIEAERRALISTHRSGIINDIVGDVVPAKYYKIAY